MRRLNLRAPITSLCLAAFGLSIAATAANARVETPRTTLYHVEVGEAGGVPLIAINGGPGISHEYLANSSVWKAISERRRIIFYDQRGTGKSPQSSNPDELSVKAMVDDLENLRRELKIDRMDLLGHSWGGILSMAYAVRYPQHVAHLIVVGSGDPKPAEHEFLWNKLFPEITATIPDDPSPAGKMGCVAVEAYDRMSYYDTRNHPRDTVTDSGSFSQQVCTTVMLDAMKLDLYPQLRRLNVPTLAINGRFDANVAPTVAYKISKAIPGARLVYFERSGHSPFVEEPDRFTFEVERFLDTSKR